jgi:hypothetical protein
MTDDQEKKELEKLNIEVGKLQNTLPNALQTLDKALEKRFGPKFKLFFAKHQELKRQGKDQEADELFNKFVNSEQV